MKKLRKKGLRCDEDGESIEKIPRGGTKA